MANENRNVDNDIAMELSNVKDEKFEVDDTYKESCIISPESGCDSLVYKVGENGNLNAISSNLRLNTVSDSWDVRSLKTENGGDSSSSCYRELENISHAKLEKTESSEDVVLSEVYFNNYIQSENNKSSVENITTFTEIKSGKDLQQLETTSVDVPSGSYMNKKGKITEQERSDKYFLNDRHSVSCEIDEEQSLLNSSNCNDQYKPEGESSLDSLRTSKRNKTKSRREQKSTNRSGGVCSNLKSETKCQPRKKTYECKVCDKKFRWPFALERHTSVHTKRKPFECEMCGNRYSRKHILYEHMKMHTYKKPYECETCDYKAARKSDLRSHIIRHQGGKLFQCEICGNKFSRNCRLVEHMRIHSGNKQFECGICEHKFTQKGILIEHMKFHAREKRYQCDICQHKCIRKSDLEVHMRYHYGEKTFKCSICENKYFQNYALKLHMRKHTGEKPYKCEVCEYKSHDIRRLNAHNVKHTGVKRYQCEICEYRSVRKRNLQQHIKVHIRNKLV